MLEAFGDLFKITDTVIYIAEPVHAELTNPFSVISLLP